MMLPRRGVKKRIHQLVCHLSSAVNSSTEDLHGFPRDPNDSRRRVSPAAERNKIHICAALSRIISSLTSPAHVLEIASGTGQHVAHYAQSFPTCRWQPTEYAGFSSPKHEQQELGDILASIDAYCESCGNVAKAVPLDASACSWGNEVEKQSFDAVLTANLLHISSPEVKRGIFAGASRVLKPAGFLIIYGPFVLEGDFLSDGNKSFNEVLHMREKEGWGLIDVQDVDNFASIAGFSRTALERLPANNLLLIYKKKQCL
jgi:SAM-dependent methyltransferase